MQQGTLIAGRLANVDEVYPSFLAFGLLTGTDANKSSHGKISYYPNRHPEQFTYLMHRPQCQRLLLQEVHVDSIS